MSDKIMIREYNCETGETIDREATPEEVISIEKTHQEVEQYRQAEQAKEAARSALLARLGITEEEARLLLG